MLDKHTNLLYNGLIQKGKTMETMSIQPEAAKCEKQSEYVSQCGYMDSQMVTLSKVVSDLGERLQPVRLSSAPPTSQGDAVDPQRSPLCARINGWGIGIDGIRREIEDLLEELEI